MPRFAEPFGTTLVEDLPEETVSNRETDFLELRLLSLKSHFFSRTYCFPRLESSPDSIISAISRLTIGREQPIISARSSWPSSGIRIVPSESFTPARVAKSPITIVRRSQKGRFSRVAKKRRLSDQKVFRVARIEIRTSFGRPASSWTTWARLKSAKVHLLATCASNKRAVRPFSSTLSE